MTVEFGETDVKSGPSAYGYLSQKSEWAVFAVAALVGASLLATSNPADARTKSGVPASPTVAKGKNIPTGGGRYHVGKPYKIAGKWYRPTEDKSYDKTGRASWYGAAFHGRRTANGEIFNMHALTAAHPTMPLPSYARVTNLANGRSVIVRVNDRGPFKSGRIIDVSRRAAEMLDFKSKGTARVRVQYIKKADLKGRDSSYLHASYRGPSKASKTEQGKPSVRIASKDRPAKAARAEKTTTKFKSATVKKWTRMLRLKRDPEPEVVLPAEPVRVATRAPASAAAVVQKPQPGPKPQPRPVETASIDPSAKRVGSQHQVVESMAYRPKLAELTAMYALKVRLSH